MTGKIFANTALAMLLLGVGSALIVAQNPQPKQSRQESRTTQQSEERAKSEGARRFQQNCARCHRAPETLSSRVAPAVLMHMRVRANLTAEDERLILKFMTQ